jgi:hypothetical protein
MAKKSIVMKDAGEKSQEYTGPFTLRRNIHSTAYEVVVHFSQTSHETLTDKIRRLIQNEARQ